jgi:hypothetical protein
VRTRFQPWQLAAIVVVLCVVAVAVTRWYQNSRTHDVAGLVGLLPYDRATRLYIDVRALRQSGLLDVFAGSRAEEEPDYRKFVEQTGFDYRTDLDAVAASFTPLGSFFAIRGRFQWQQLANYAAVEGGSCVYVICEMPGSRADRRISFYPVANDTLALAVSPNQRGVNLIAPGQRMSGAVPADPVWMSIPAAVLREAETLPDSVRSVLAPLAESGNNITIGAGPDGNRLQLRLEVACTTADAAQRITRDLASATKILKEVIAQRSGAPDPGDLSGVLVAGSFRQQDTRVIGTWPLERSFLKSLAGQIE